MKFLFVIDELDKLNPTTDTTLEIIKGCLQENIDCFICEAKDLFYLNDKTHCTYSRVVHGNDSFTATDQDHSALDDFSLVLMRKEPPYDLEYHHATMLLDKTKTTVVNVPLGLREANEKLATLNFPDIIPPTLVTSRSEEIQKFIAEHGTVVVKPIEYYGGKGVEKHDSFDAQKIMKLTDNGTQSIIVQKFVQTERSADKRILVLDCAILGAVSRVPQEGEFRANLALGATPEAAEITEQDKHIVKTIAEYLRDNGLAFVGIDVVGDKLIEINVTCPTGLVQVNQFSEKSKTPEIVSYLMQIAD